MKQIKSLFKNFRTNIHYLKDAFSLLLGYKRKIAIIFLCMIFSFVIGFVQPFISQKLIDNGIVKKDFRAIALFCGVLLGIYVFSFVINIIKEKNRHSVLRIEKKFSAKALSYGFPRLDIEGVM